jgi:uncharacterized protein with NRDE domain
MCTVSFYKSSEYVIITSNRDESINRVAATHPAPANVNGARLFFPRDPQGGGSWFVVKENGDALVLLNGAANRHEHRPPYRESRGMILLNLSAAPDFHEEWNSHLNLANIEPFTIVAFVNNELFQLRWNGDDKELSRMNVDQPHIWSSATLYAPEVILRRRKWFDEFMVNHQHPLVPEDLISFHTQTQTNDTENGVLINRNGILLTKNVTQVVLEKEKFRLHHRDLVHNTQTTLIENVL